MDISRLSRTYKSARRLQQIINVFLKYGFGQIIEQIHLGRYIPFKKRLKSFGAWPSLQSLNVPERLRMAFAELGPSFIKLAQLLSTRPDLITVEFADELKKLQDDVPPFPASEAKNIIETEFEQPVMEIFSYFVEQPVAAASIAQVHRAVLLDGSVVIVKVQRPGIKSFIESDIAIFFSIARLLDKYISDSRFFNPIGIVEEFSRTIKKEMDFVEESRNCARFRKNFENDPDIYIPRIYPQYVTQKVFVMEWIDGVRIDDIEEIERLGFDRSRLAEIGVRAFFKQVMEDGFFHADPHAGNLLAMPSGSVAFLDFGIVGRVSDEMRETIANTFLALVKKDFDGIINQYVALGILPEHTDIEVFRREFKTDLVDFLEPLYGLSLQELNFALFLDTLTHLAIKHNLKVPAELLLIDKTMLILENIGRQLDPQFNFIAAAEPYALRLVQERSSPARFYKRAKENLGDLSDFVSMFPRQMKELIKKVLKDDINIRMYHVNLPEFIRDMDRSSNRIAFAMIVSAMILSSAIMHAAGVGPRVYGMSILAISAFVFAFLLGVWLIISIIRSGRF